MNLDKNVPLSAPSASDQAMVGNAGGDRYSDRCGVAGWCAKQRGRVYRKTTSSIWSILSMRSYALAILSSPHLWKQPAGKRPGSYSGESERCTQDGRPDG